MVGLINEAEAKFLENDKQPTFIKRKYMLYFYLRCYTLHLLKPIN